MKIHQTAIVDAAAHIGPEAEVGPYSIVGPGAVSGRSALSTPRRHRRIGEDGHRKLYRHGVVLGAGPQDLASSRDQKHRGNRTWKRDPGALHDHRGATEGAQRSSATEFFDGRHAPRTHFQIGNGVVIATILARGTRPDR